MPAAIDQAPDTLRQAPARRQNEITDYISHPASDELEDIYPADRASVLEGMAQAERRQFASDEQVAAVFASFGK